MNAADSARARGFFCAYAALDFFTPLIVAGLLLLALAPLAADGVLQGTPLSDTMRALSSAGKRVFGLCLVGMIATALTERCEWSAKERGLQGVRSLCSRV